MTTPQDFLKQVKDYYRFKPSLETVRNEEFSRLNDLEAETFDKDLKEKYKNYDVESDEIVLNLIKDVTLVATTEEKGELQKVAFGKVYDTTINAFCIKSNDGFNNYCIVINEGLLILLHKYGKLSYASVNPKSVIFCNRGDYNNIEPHKYREWANELVELYKTHDTPVGAMVKLNSIGSLTHGINLHIQELFILCHELGHFYNRDLETSLFLVNLLNTSWSVIDDNKDHEIEYKADLTGFDLLTKVTKSKFNLGKKYCLIQVAIVFDLLAMIDPNPSDDHPAPLDRICNIIFHFFGEEFVEAYIQTYSNGLEFTEFYDSLKE